MRAGQTRPDVEDWDFYYADVVMDEPQFDMRRLLGSAGYRLVTVADSHLCCGSAGSYSILQPKLSTQLRDNKLERLQEEQPDVIATANVGCQMHLAAASRVPVLHWLELLR